jgi:hypothetical protein
MLALLGGNRDSGMRRNTILFAITAMLVCSIDVLANQPAIDSVAAAAAKHGAADTDVSRVGIWKSVTPPPGSMHGEFGGNDPLGLAAGAKIPADCSINWVDPDSNKLYCFASATSLVYFLDAPHTLLTRARQYWSGSGRK